MNEVREPEQFSANPSPLFYHPIPITPTANARSAFLAGAHIVDTAYSHPIVAILVDLSVLAVSREPPLTEGFRIYPPD